AVVEKKPRPWAEARGERMDASGRTGSANMARADDARPLVVVDDVTLQYKTADHLVTATWKVGFEVYRSDRYVLLGPSGCGKTTILKAIAGFMAPVAGSITLAGHPIERPGPDRMMVFQEFDQLLPWRTVLGNVLFPLLVNRRMPRAAAHDHARALLAKVNLTRFEHVYPHMLSGGMKQRVAIAPPRARAPRAARRPRGGGAVRGARRAPPPQDAGGAGRAVGGRPLHGDFRHPFDRGGPVDRQPHPRAVAAPRARQGGAQCRP